MATEFIGVTFVVISIVIFVLCLILHCGRHFSFRCCIRSKNYINSSHPNGVTKRHSLRVHSDNIMRQIKRNERICQCCMLGIEDNFDFFPISFLLFNLFIITLALLIIFKYSIVNNNINNMNLIIITTEHNYTTSIDWIIVYSLIFLSLWESLFNFHRFYTTYFASRKMVVLNLKQVILKFSVFAIPYICLFLLQIHVWYYLYPLVILFYLMFNVINVWLFGHILIVQYRFVMGTEKYLTNIHDDMLASVYLMRNISLMSCICSSFYISLFTVFYNINIILFIPILWSISCICLTLNFVRNRQYIHAKYLSFQLWAYGISCNCYETNSIHRLNSTNNKQTNILQRQSLPSTNIKTQIQGGGPHTVIQQNDKQSISVQQNNTIDKQNKSDTTTIVLNDINFENNDETNQEQKGDNTPSMIIPSKQPTFENNHSHSKSKSKSKWWAKSPLSRNKHNTFSNDADFPLSVSPINTINTMNAQISPNGDSGTNGSNNATLIRKISESESNSSPDTRKRNISKSKALSRLGIGSRHNKTHTTQTDNSLSKQSKQSKHNKDCTIPLYEPPSTPMPSLFSHLWDNKHHTASPRFPSKRPPCSDTLYEDVEHDTVRNTNTNTNTNNHKNNPKNNNIMEQRDEFNENEMAEMTYKFQKKKDLIRVSAKQPELMMQRISTEIDTPKGIGIGIGIVNNLNSVNSVVKLGNTLKTPSSRSGSRSPFSRKKADDKQVSLLMDQETVSPIEDIKNIIDEKLQQQQISDLRVSITITNTNTLADDVMTEIIIDDTSESEEEPQVMNLPNYLQNDKNNINDSIKGTHIQSLSDLNVTGNDKQQIQQKEIESANNTKTISKTSKFGSFIQKVITPRSRRHNNKKIVTFAADTENNKNKNKNIQNGKRIRSQSDVKGTNLDRTNNNNMKHFNATKSMTNVDGIVNNDGNSNSNSNPDVVSLFDVLAKHGFYSQQNVVSAKQLKDYHMKSRV